MENIKNLLINKKILVVSHDVGGANIIKNFIDHYNVRARYYLRGPSLNIFKKKIHIFVKIAWLRSSFFLHSYLYSINVTNKIYEF